MTYTHINLTSQERTYENDDDVVVLLSLYNANLENNLIIKTIYSLFSKKINFLPGSTAFLPALNLSPLLSHLVI